MTNKGEIEIDLVEGMLRHAGKKVYLTRRLLKLAHILTTAMPSTVTHETIAAKMWGDKEIDVLGNTKVAVTHLRKQLRPLGILIVINWGIGYRIEFAPVMSQTERTNQPVEGAHAQA